MLSYPTSFCYDCPDPEAIAKLPNERLLQVRETIPCKPLAAGRLATALASSPLAGAGKLPGGASPWVRRHLASNVVVKDSADVGFAGKVAG